MTGGPTLKRLVLSLWAISLICGQVAPGEQTESRTDLAGDWPQWRGVNRDGLSAETGLLQAWPEQGPPLRWRVDGLGSGYSSVAIERGRVFTMGQRPDGAFLIALNTTDGSELWATSIGQGVPNSTPTVDGDFVYALGLEGDLVCVDAETGEVSWHRNIQSEFDGSVMSDLGYSESVLVDGDRLICTPGAPDAALVALDKKTGETLWQAALPDSVGPNGIDGAGYSSAVISEACGIRQYVQLMGRGAIAVDAESGRTLWTYNRIANAYANIATPIVKEDYVFCSAAYGAGSVLLKVSPDGDGLEAEEVYYLDHKELQNHHGGLVLVGDYLYAGHGHNNGFPLCLGLKTGEIAWRPGRGPGTGSAAVLYADGHVYFRYENGTMALIEATPEAYRVKGQFRAATDNGKGWSHPVIAGGCLYLRDQGTLLCYGLRR